MPMNTTLTSCGSLARARLRARARVRVRVRIGVRVRFRVRVRVRVRVRLRSPLLPHEALRQPHLVHDLVRVEVAHEPHGA